MVVFLHYDLSRFSVGRYMHADEFLTPDINGGLAHAVALGHLGHAVLVGLTQDSNNLFITVSFLLHVLLSVEEAIIPKLRRIEKAGTGQEDDPFLVPT